MVNALLYETETTAVAVVVATKVIFVVVGVIAAADAINVENQ